MIIIGSDGQYQYIGNTKTLKTSTHPAYQAFIEVNLPRGSWIGAPNKGHRLNKNEKQSFINREEMKKELSVYLNKYSPDIQEEAIKRSGYIVSSKIREDAIND